MPDNLDRYLPDWNDEEVRAKLVGFTREQLLELLIRSYREKRVMAKSLQEKMQLLQDITDLLEKPSALLHSLDVPTAEDLRRMTGTEEAED